MLSDVTEAELRTLIEFMYCGEATIDQSRLESLLKVPISPGVPAVGQSAPGAGCYSIINSTGFWYLSVFEQYCLVAGLEKAGLNWICASQ